MANIGKANLVVSDLLTISEGAPNLLYTNGFIGFYQNSLSLKSAILDSDGAIITEYGNGVTLYDDTNLFEMNGITGAILWDTPGSGRSLLTVFHAIPTNEIRIYDVLNGTRKIYTPPGTRKILRRVLCVKNYATWLEWDYEGTGGDITFYSVIQYHNNDPADFNSFTLTPPNLSLGIDISQTEEPISFGISLGRSLWEELEIFYEDMTSFFARADVGATSADEIFTSNYSSMHIYGNISDGSSFANGRGDVMAYSSVTGIPAAEDFIPLWPSSFGTAIGIPSNGIMSGGAEGLQAIYDKTGNGRMVLDSSGGSYGTDPLIQFEPDEFNGVSAGLVIMGDQPPIF